MKLNFLFRFKSALKLGIASEYRTTHLKIFHKNHMCSLRTREKCILWLEDGPDQCSLSVFDGFIQKYSLFHAALHRSQQKRSAIKCQIMSKKIVWHEKNSVSMAEQNYSGFVRYKLKIYFAVANKLQQRDLSSVVEYFYIKSNQINETTRRLMNRSGQRIIFHCCRFVALTDVYPFQVSSD